MKGCKFYLHIGDNKNQPFGIQGISEDGEVSYCKNLFADRNQAERFIDLMNGNSIEWDVMISILELNLNTSYNRTAPS